MSEVLTITDAAERLKLSDRTINAMLAAGQLPGFKVRGQWRILSNHFDLWLELVGSGLSSEVATEKVTGRTRPDSAIQEISPQDSEPEAPNLQPSEVARPTSIKPLTERVTQVDLHRLFVDTLGDAVVDHSSFDKKPLEIDLSPPLPPKVRVYLFNATRPPGGRTPGEHKVQLMVPGQRRGERGQFDHSEGRLVLLCGYAAEEDVFVLWDAGLYPDFAWSRNVQVKVETLIEASAGKIARQERRLRPADGTTAIETLIAFPRSRLADAIELRLKLTRNRLAEE